MPSSHDSIHKNGDLPVTNGHLNGYTNGNSHDHHDAKNVGIVAMEVYFPSTYVDQTKLEKFDGVSAGKYTVGLGQERMGFCMDREDIVSMCMTVVDRLMKRTETSYAKIGRLDVGTETLIDKSKSIKTCLMKLFEESGNFDVEGVDNLNACYGGTAALFNCVNWVESSAWDGRYAIAVAGDIAVYEKGNARATGGAGAVAMLIGPNAGVVLDQGVRGSSMKPAYDFYKPNFSSEYPVVDGPKSLKCYKEALDGSYEKFREKFDQRILHNGKTQRRAKAGLDVLDYIVFHSPFSKMVQKSLAHLVFHDFLQSSQQDNNEKDNALDKYRNFSLNEAYDDRELEKLLVKLSEPVFLEKTDAAQTLARNVGNMYTASVYGGLASLIAGKTVDELRNKRVGLFSYGSGAAASFFSARFVPSPSLNQLVESLKTLFKRLDERQEIEPEIYDEVLQHKEDRYNLVPFDPTSDLKYLDKDVYYLTGINDKYERAYAKTASR